MAGYMLKGFGTCFKIDNLFRVGHGFVCALLVPMADVVGATDHSTCFSVEMCGAVLLSESTPITDAVSSMVGSKVVWNTCLTPDEPWWLATRSLGDCVSLEVSGVLHHASRHCANMWTRPQLLLLSLGEGESLCTHILCIN